MFIPLDKNVATYCVTCPSRHGKQFDNHFGTINDKKAEYELTDSSENKIRKIVEEDYKNKKLHQIMKCRQKWVFPKASLLYKNKDINRVRPIISYAAFHSQPLGKTVARALTVIIKKKIGEDLETPNLFTNETVVKKKSRLSNDFKSRRMRPS